MNHIALPTVLTRDRCRTYKLLLALFWISGLFCGVFFISAAKEPFSSLMHTAAFSRVSIVGLTAVLAFPLIISALAVHFSVPALLFLICYIKAFAYGCCLFGISVAFGSAGWLVHCLLLFSDSCMIIPLLWFWYRHLTGNRSLVKRDLVICAVLAAVLGSIDYFLVSPYLAVLLNY